MPLFRGSRRFESSILSHHSRFNVTYECNNEEIDDDDDDGAETVPSGRPAGLYLLQIRAVIVKVDIAGTESRTSLNVISSGRIFMINTRAQ